MAEAYVLAGELRHCGGDHATAFARYEERLMPLLKQKQKFAAKFGSSFAPKTRLGLAFRNLVLRLLGLPGLVDLLFGRVLRDETEISDYGF